MRLRTPQTLRALALVLTLVVVAAACGDADDSGIW